MKEYDLQAFFELLCRYGLENKPICAMSREEVLQLLRIVEASDRDIVPF